MGLCRSPLISSTSTVVAAAGRSVTSGWRQGLIANVHSKAPIRALTWRPQIMEFRTLLVISVALALDALAVAVVAGLTIDKITIRHVFRLAFHFGLFQAVMFAIGWSFGSAVHKIVAAFDHWLAFLLLLFVGINILRGSYQRERAPHSETDPTSGWMLVTLSMATSIDALAVGFSLAMINISLGISALTVGLTASAFTVSGMVLGRRAGQMWGRSMELVGGMILIFIGSRILWQHLTS